MKLTYFLVFLASVAAERLKFTPEGFNKLVNVRNECFEEESVDPKYLPQLDTASNFPSIDEIKCHSLCTIHKLKFLDGDLRFQIEHVDEFITDPLLQVKLKGLLNECLPTNKKVISCDDAHDLYLCILRKYD